jgi:hypothetical protein
MPALLQAVGTAGSGTTGAVTINWPTHAKDDIGILLFETNGGDDVANIAAGWTELASSPQDSGAGTTRLTAFWKRAANNTEAAATCDVFSDHFHAKIVTFRGCVPTGSPIDSEAGGIKADASANVTIPGVQATRAGNDVLYVAVRDNDSGSSTSFSGESNSQLTSITEAETGTALGNGGGMAIWYGNKATAGQTGTLYATVTSSAGAFMCVTFLDLVRSAATSFSAPGNTFIPTVISNTVELDQVARYVMCEAAGDVVLVAPDDTTVTLTAAAGKVCKHLTKRIHATGTTIGSSDITLMG